MFRQRILELIPQWSAYAAKVRVNKYDPVHKLICNDIPAALEAWTSPVSKYKFKGSDGQGNILLAPWFAVFNGDVTTKASMGYYLVYLLSQDLQTLVLEIGFGATQFKDKFGEGPTFFEEVGKAVKHMSASSEYLVPKTLKFTLPRTNVAPVKLAMSKDFNLRAYESCSIYSVSYVTTDLPSDEELRVDYCEFLKLYDLMVDSLLLGDVDDYIVETLDSIEQPSEVVPKQFVPRLPKKRNGAGIAGNGHGRRCSRIADKVGRLGEEWVFEYEKTRLCNAGLEELANKVVLHRECAESRTPGWDITSFELDGSSRLIEVKAGEGSTINDVILTKNEWEKASKPELAPKYWIYLVTDITSAPKLEILANPFEYVDSGVLAVAVDSYCLSLRECLVTAVQASEEAPDLQKLLG